MNKNLIRNKHEVFTYELKEGTKSSYYRVDGGPLLPFRVSFSSQGFFELNKKGRAISENKVGQILGCFKKNEDSTYKQNKPFEVYSSVWQATDYPEFLGYGDIGLSNEEGRIKASKDLFILVKKDKVLELHLFPSLVPYKEEVLEYLRGLKKANP